MEERSSPSQQPTQETLTAAAKVGMTLAVWASHVPDAPAIVSPSGDRTFSQLNGNVNRLVRALRDAGLAVGDSVALLCGNRPEFAEVLYACQRGGYRYTPVNWHLTADEAGYIVNDCAAKALIADATYAESVRGVPPLCPGLTVKLAIGGAIDGFTDYARALGAQSAEDIDDPKLGNRMMYTSGTTGRPKGVARPPVAVVARSATQTAARYAAGTGQLHLCTGPLYHAAPLAFSLTVPLMDGVGTVLMERWDAEQALALIARHRITHTHMVPTMFHRLLRLPPETRARHDISSLRYVLHGAAPCPVATKKALIDWLGPIVWERAPRSGPRNG